MNKKENVFFSSYMISFYLGLTSWTERYLCKKSPLVGGCVTHSCNGSFLENECLRSWFSVCSSSLILSRDWKWMSPYSPLTLSLPSIGNVTASMDLHRINCRPKKESFKIYQNHWNCWIALGEFKTVLKAEQIYITLKKNSYFRLFQSCYPQDNWTIPFLKLKMFVQFLHS